MSYVVFDTEYTTWEGCQEKGWIEPQKKEIVQIGALKVEEETYQVLDTLDILVRPSYNPVLSAYFEKLTHITNQQVQSAGVDFLTAYQKFKAFIGNDICFSHAWDFPYQAAADGDIMNLNLYYFECLDDHPPTYLNIAAYFKEMYKRYHIPIQKQASGEIIEKLGLPIPPGGITKHNALYDGFSILAGLKYFKFNPRIYQEGENSNSLSQFVPLNKTHYER